MKTVTHTQRFCPHPCPQTKTATTNICELQKITHFEQFQHDGGRLRLGQGGRGKGMDTQGMMEHIGCTGQKQPHVLAKKIVAEVRSLRQSCLRALKASPFNMCSY